MKKKIGLSSSDGCYDIPKKEEGWFKVSPKMLATLESVLQMAECEAATRWEAGRDGEERCFEESKEIQADVNAVRKSFFGKIEPELCECGRYIKECTVNIGAKQHRNLD